MLSQCFSTCRSNKKEKGWIDEDEQTKLKSLPMKFKGV